MRVESPKEQVLAHWELINRLALRRFDSSSLAEEAALYVTDGLLEDGGRRVSAYRGKAPFTAYLASVVQRLLEDFARQKYGRRQTPRWIRNLGGIWVRLYRLLCLERMKVDEAVAVMEQGEGASAAVSVDDAAWKILQEVVDCGAHQGLEVSRDEVDLPVGDARSAMAVFETVEDEERRELFRKLFCALTDIDEAAVEGNLELLGSVRISMTGREKLMLKLCYRDGLSVARAGEMLGYNRYQMHGRLRRLLARIREAFEESGIGMEILELLR